MQGIFYLPEDGKYVNLKPPATYSSAVLSTVYVDMKSYRHCDFILQFGSCSSIASDQVTVKQAVNTSGSSAANLTVGGYWHNRTALGSSSIANDTMEKVAASSMNSSGAAFKLASNSTSNQVYVVPVEAADLSASSSMDAAGIGIATMGKAVVGVSAVLSGARYRDDNPPSAL